MSVTVGVATCGRPASLARCLRGLSEQELPAEEVIVVDQAPSPEARTATASAGLRGLRYVEQERLGLSASRNLSLRLATGAVLAVTDDDCVPDRSWLAAATAALERSARPAAVTGPILALGGDSPGSFAISLRESDLAVDYAGRVLPWIVGSGGNFAGPCETLRGCGGWDERLGAGSAGRAAEDADLIYRLLMGGSTIRYEPRAIVRHERQSRERRLATRWSYGYGIGAMCGIWLARRDPYAVRMLAGYARMHLPPMLTAMRDRRRGLVEEHSRALGSLLPGLLQGLRVAGDPAHHGPRGTA